MTLGKREGTGVWEMKHWMALGGELDLELGCGPVLRQTIEWCVLTHVMIDL